MRRRQRGNMVMPMQIDSSAKAKVNFSLRRVQVFLTAAGGILVVFLFLLLSTKPSKEESTMQAAFNAKIVQDSVEGLDYYHCPASSQADSTLDLVLLHGAAFTKEDWKKSGILEKLCLKPNMSVTALNLSVKANSKELQKALDNLRTKQVLQSKPVALVTPSASGAAVVDWIMSGDNVDTLTQYVKFWIPVAAGSVSKADEAALERLNGKIKTLAIYGSRDKNGKATSKRLQEYSGATLVEIDGGHPCYLDSPGDFIRELLQFLEV